MKSRKDFSASSKPAGVIPDNPHHLRWHAVHAERVIDSGRIVSMLASSLSFEYQYRLNMVITEYAGNIDLLIVPLLSWLRTNEPDIMVTGEKRCTGLPFRRM